MTNWTFLITSILIGHLSSVICSFCYWNSGCPYKYLSSKTPYNFIRGDFRDSVIHLHDCEPLSIWTIMRHGKRTPGPLFTQNIKSAIHLRKPITDSYLSGRSSLCAQDIEDLRNWKMDTSLFDPPHTMSEEGYRELKDLGKRFKETFPNLLGSLKNNTYYFRPAYDTISINSIKAFISGFKDDNLTFIEPTDGYDEAIPTQKCEFYQKGIRLNPKTYTEAFKYLENSEYLATKDRLQRRTGINFTLTADNITGLYDLCRYSSSGYTGKLSPWCAIFTTTDLQVLEYVDDLRHFYRNGYGNPYAPTFGRLFLRNLIASFEKAKSGEGKKITAYATHSTMLDMLYTALGLYKDADPLTGTKRNPGRKWRSIRSTFSTNFSAVLHRCLRNGNEEYNVIFYQNEEPLRSLCKEGVCTWQEFIDICNDSDINLDFCDDKIDI